MIGCNSTDDELSARAAPTCGAEFTPAHTDYMERHSCALPNGHEGAHACAPKADSRVQSASAFAEEMKRETEAALASADEQDERMAAGARGEPFYRRGEYAEGKPEGLSFAAPEIREHLASMDPTTAALAAQAAERERVRAEIDRVGHALLAALPDGPDAAGTERTLSGLANLAIKRLGRIEAERDTARRDLAEVERVFEIIDTSNRRAIEMFKEAHPESRIAFPDRATMLVWLLEQLDTVTREADAMRAQIEHRDMTATPRESDRETISRLARQLDELGEAIANSKRAGMELAARCVRLEHDAETTADRRAADTTALDRLQAEAEGNRRQIDTLTRLCNEAEERFTEANHNHGETSAALSAMTIKWLNLGNEAKAMLRRGMNPPDGHRAPSVAELRIKLRTVGEERDKCRMRIEQIEDACWKAIEMIDPASGLPFYSERCVDIETAVKFVVVGLLREINANRAALAAGAINIGNVTRERDSLTEQLRVADADRIPLAQDLQIVRDNLRDANTGAERGSRVLDVVKRWRDSRNLTDAHQLVRSAAMSGADAALCEAWDEHEKASADPAYDDRPF